MDDAERLVVHRKPAEALRRLQTLLQSDSVPPRAWKLAGEAHERLGHADEAVRCYLRVPETDPMYGSSSRMNAARLLRASLGRWSQAASIYRRLVQRNPENRMAQMELAELLTVAGGSWEAIPHLLAVIRSGEFQRTHLMTLANTQAVALAPEQIAHARENAPDDSLVLLASGVERAAHRDWQEARSFFEKAVRADSALWEAHGRLGLALCELKDWQAMKAWWASLPDHERLGVPNAWIAAGRWAESAGDSEGALRCYLEALQLDPTDIRVHTRLAPLLDTHGHPDLARRVAERTRQLIRVHEFVDRIESSPLELPRAEPLVEALLSLGRRWEAWGWLRLITEARAELKMPYEETKARALELGRSLDDEDPWVDPEPLADVLALVAKYAMPKWDGLRMAGGESTELERADGAGDGVRFALVTEQAKLAFAYYNGTEKPSPAPKLVEVDGGGIGVLDYDADGWPDLWWTQGSTWPPRPDSRWLDQLYRNRGDGTFQDVTSEARILEWGFSQGIAVGDFNGDGFDDVVVANIGRNRWFRNQGDGTFEEVTDEIGVEGEEWTSSLLLADLDGDGLSDLYEVNYLAGEESRTRRCPDRNGALRICRPMMFDAERDRVWLNRGDGTFADVSDSCGVSRYRGRGLGITTWRDAEDPGRLHLFVANDVTENFLWLRASSHGKAALRYREAALPAGVAVDADGRAQACMGIAVEDFDQDGRLDFFVTNFYDEWNTLYRHVADRLFVDATRESGLGRPSRHMLGFGTQPLDVNLDGLPDLVVANGHLVNETRFQVPYRMVPQCFVNLGNGRFAELTGGGLGEYFQRRWLGRGMARLDYDRDGREDFAVSHLYDRGELVANRCVGGYTWLAFSLRARTTAREAVGARVTLVTDASERTIELTAGSGYQASNERRLLFAWRTAETGENAETVSPKVEQVIVQWPSGKESVFPAPAPNRDYIIVEGAAKLWELPR